MASALSKNLLNKLKSWNFPLIIQAWIFFLVMLFFQLIWESFESELNSFPPFVFISDAIGKFLLNTTPAIINPVFDVDIVRDGISLILPNGLYINYFFYLSGVKQMCLVVTLFLIMPGAWFKRLWFIPLCLIIIQITVFVRFFVLNIHCLTQPEHIHLLQDMLFGPLFYFEILVLWLAWVLIVAKTASLKHPSPTIRKS
ncbi:MAG: hypothetical protein ABIJ04_06540 [Bacteroidota bacterium]